MSYTAAALSFMLENLSKPVVLTGSQVIEVNETKSKGMDGFDLDPNLWNKERWPR